MTAEQMQTVMDELAIPRLCQNGLIEYIIHHRPVGSFLTSVLQNDLRKAVMHADSVNKQLLVNYVSFLYNNAPIVCWGSPDLVEAWLKQRKA